ncbi:NAD(+) diphosphatase [Streptomyces termitum]
MPDAPPGPAGRYDGLAYNDPPRGGPRRASEGPTAPTAGALLVPLHRDRCLTRGGQPLLPAASPGGRAVLAAADQLVLLSADRSGTAGGTGGEVWGADLSHLPEETAAQLVRGAEPIGVRGLFGTLPGARAGLLARASGLLHWHRTQRYCGTCGAATRSRTDGAYRECTGPGCGKELYPRLEPAVIVLVEAPGPDPACLLARHRGAGPDHYSLVAGFVEVGDSLEGAVRRELAEEAGVTVDHVVYQASQAWPFPAGLMVGFRAVARTRDTAVDHDELLEARWFSRAEVRRRALEGPGLGPADSIGHALLTAWLAE